MQNAPDITFVAQWADRVGVVILLMFIVVGAVRQWWVPGWVYTRCLADADDREKKAMAIADEWKSIAKGALPLTRQLATTTSDVVAVLKSKDGG